MTATRNFHHRVETFRKEIIFGRNNPMAVKYISYRVEFQGRGAAHIHGTLWLNIAKIEEDINEDNLQEAFIKLRNDISLTESEKHTISKFTDRFISCSLNPSTVHRDPTVGKRIVDIVKAVNCHKCTSPCQKYGDRCKYGFPRFPLRSTLVIDKSERKNNSENNTSSETEKKKKNFEKLLNDVENILTDDILRQYIMEQYEKGTTESEYNENRSKRIDLLLEIAGDYTYPDYVEAIKKSKLRGSTVLLRRDVDEIHVNNYNPEWIEAWNANMDIQPCLDYFSLITYVTDYWSKAHEGLTQKLTEAAVHLRGEPDKQKRCQQLANIFMTHRQMSEAEAYYKILPNLTLKYSNIDTVFIPSDRKELRSKFLQKINEDDQLIPKGAEVKGGRDGLFTEKPDIISKYCRRKITEDNPELGALSLMQFAKNYQPVRQWKDDEESALIAKKESKVQEKIGTWENEEERVADFYVTTNEKYHYTRLPNVIRLNDCNPGEVPIWVKRTFPKAARIHKKKENNDPHRFFYQS